MAVLTFEGHVQNGQIRLPDDVKLPEDAKVYVVVPDLAPAGSARLYSPRLAHPDQAADFVKEVIEVPADAQL
jgi:hypothetical protein